MRCVIATHVPFYFLVLIMSTGALVLVDGAHALGQIPIDITDINADVITHFTLLVILYDTLITLFGAIMLLYETVVLLGQCPQMAGI
jgi:hypothetical protein